MRLETVSEFKIMQSKKDIGYTYFRFDKNEHKELCGCPVAAINIDGAYILIPFQKSRSKSRVITDEMINQRLDEVVSSIRSGFEVITDSIAEKNQNINSIQNPTEYSREGIQARPTETDLRSVPEEVRRFESGPSHFSLPF